jgi:hypothetical protein
MLLAVLSDLVKTANLYPTLQPKKLFILQRFGAKKKHFKLNLTQLLLFICKVKHRYYLNGSYISRSSRQKNHLTS